MENNTYGMELHSIDIGIAATSCRVRFVHEIEHVDYVPTERARGQTLTFISPAIVESPTRTHKTNLEKTMTEQATQPTQLLETNHKQMQRTKTYATFRSDPTSPSETRNKPVDRTQPCKHMDIIYTNTRTTTLNRLPEKK